MPILAEWLPVIVPGAGDAPATVLLRPGTKFQIEPGITCQCGGSVRVIIRAHGRRYCVHCIDIVPAGSATPVMGCTPCQLPTPRRQVAAIPKPARGCAVG